MKTRGGGLLLRGRERSNLQRVSKGAPPTGRLWNTICSGIFLCTACGLLIACGSTQGSTRDLSTGVTIASGHVEGVSWKLSLRYSGQERCVTALVGDTPAPAVSEGCARALPSSYWSGPTVVPVGHQEAKRVLLFFFVKPLVKYLKVKLSKPDDGHQWFRVPVQRLSSAQVDAGNFPGPTAYGYVFAANVLRGYASVCVQRALVFGWSGSLLERSPQFLCRR